ncbi:polyprenyl synthetase family protein [Alteribacillus sp. HJP-4]|uniref:polyprenyl synthetase family protein n=1 Tax=Alteribacillus sp. HJP-4 TaxID=2775394 RepID=UPI0035CD110A
MDLQTFIERFKKEIDMRLPRYINEQHAPASLKESMLYSLNAGGKRVRPLLMIATIEAYHEMFEHAYDAACAVEMIHTYSLIHDDLPAMDNDDIRRGSPTNHIVYGEAAAILAGDALLTKAFEVISHITGISHADKILLIQELSRASGAEGMVGGQAADLEAEGQTISIDKLEHIHHHKTGDLLCFSIVAGGILAGAPGREIENLRSFARELGLVFQIKDDILDVEGDSKEMGKTAGSDEGNDKSTYPKLLSLDGSKDKLKYHAERAKTYLQKTSADRSLLEEFVTYIVERRN